MPAPIIILRPSANIYDWSIQANESGPAAVATTDPGQADLNLNALAFGPGLTIDGYTLDGWEPARTASARFDGVPLRIEFLGADKTLNWSAGGGHQAMNPVPSPAAGWNALLRKVEPFSLQIVPLAGGDPKDVFAIRISHV